MKWLEVHFFLGVEDERDADEVAQDVAQLVCKVDRVPEAPPWLTMPPYYISDFTVTENPPESPSQEQA